MSETRSYPRRLIEVDLPIREISAHARREKSIRHGHISTLHIWWARRPLAACRAVLCAALWPDPADDLCPQEFRDCAAEAITVFAQKATSSAVLSAHCSGQALSQWLTLVRLDAGVDTHYPKHLDWLRTLLFYFIADFANWDNSTVPEYLETARALTQAAHEALGGEPGTRPLVVDPFAGGGAIPLEALRVGADAFASDLNPVAVLLNKVVLEYIPKYGQKLADEVRRWGAWIKKQAEQELAEFYPPDEDGATPIAYLWARTITCEGPNCGAEVPLMRSLWLAKKGNRSVALKLIPDQQARRVDFEIVHNPKAKDVGEGTVRRGSATCPVCGYTTPVASVRAQLKTRHGGAADARLFCVVTTHPRQQGRFYRLPTQHDLDIVRRATEELEHRKAIHAGPLSLLPDERLDIRGIRHTWVMVYGVERWGDLFTPRQALALTTMARLVQKIGEKLATEYDSNLAAAVQTCLALNVDKVADLANSLCVWEPGAECPRHLFARQAIPMAWDFGEGVVIGESSGSWSVMVERFSYVMNELGSDWNHTLPQQTSATLHPLPDDAAQCFFTDPPYYDAVSYAYLSDFFYIWLTRSLIQTHPQLLKEPYVPKDAEIVVDRPHELSNSTKDITFYERELTKSFAEGRRILRPDGIGTIVFASKTTASWEAILQAVLEAGWTITGSWPVDTEMETRVAAQGQARLASSIHLICRPREDASAGVTDMVGDWRDVLAELPRRIHDWLPRLAREGVVGADAIFACLGPALEIFSRYSRVEKASGEPVPLREYLEHVWAAVAREALATIFEGADSSGFEEDARLTAIWFWVLKAVTQNGNNGTISASFGDNEDTEDDTEEPESTQGKKKVQGYLMEYDAARKLAQGLGADLSRLSRAGGIITISGSIATLNGITSRESYLIGQQLSLFRDEMPDKTKRTRASKRATIVMQDIQSRQPLLFSDEPDQPIADPQQPMLPTFEQPTVLRPLMDRLLDSGVTTLDRLHQAMLLFGHSQTALIGQFLAETHMDTNPRFWQLAQALSALYPSGTDEKRWVDGVLARKKSFGF